MIIPCGILVVYHSPIFGNPALIVQSRTAFHLMYTSLGLSSSRAACLGPHQY